MLRFWRLTSVFVVAAVGLSACSGGSLPYAQSLPSASYKDGGPVHFDPALMIRLRKLARLRHFDETGWAPGQTIYGRPDVVMLQDGEIATLPDTVDPYYYYDVKKVCLSWVGYTPPTCDNTGPFRRIYSSPNSSYISNQWITPPNQATFPVTSNSSGYLYVTGYPIHNLGNNTEAGFLYSNTYNWYTAYQSWPGGTWYDQSGVHFAPGHVMAVTLEGSNAANCVNTSNTCALASYGGTCTGSQCSNQNVGCNPNNNMCYRGHDAENDSGWPANNCCVTASMFTIAQTGGNHFKNGDVFGPTSELACAAYSESAACSPNLLTGKQIYPNNTTKVIVTKVNSIGSETDEIDLHN